MLESWPLCLSKIEFAVLKRCGNGSAQPSPRFLAVMWREYGSHR